ncbi:hypothetical protein [Nicoliella lavandulae]|uniref:Uncharacterized protein n=1 Tax=Nicoliella lavandulae TaxID=3082954 RepID=A0ABU8SLX1_9LACO
MHNFTNEEATVLSNAFLSFKDTLQSDNQRGRSELDGLSEQVLNHHSLNPLGTDFTFVKMALKNYRKLVQDTNILATIDNLIARYKGIC